MTARGNGQRSPRCTRVRCTRTRSELTDVRENVINRDSLLSAVASVWAIGRGVMGQASWVGILGWAIRL
jgi:hypothetical protein